MRELFSDISQSTRTLTDFWIKMALGKTNPMEGLLMLIKFENSLPENEREYVNFCFTTELEKMRNESNND